jgi:hypothetical protein
VVARLRAVVGEQLRAAQMARAPLAPEPAAVVGDGGPAVQLLAAAREGDAAAVSLLLEVRADPNASVAAQHGRLEVARLLLDGGADPSCVGGGRDDATPLMLAARSGQLEVLRLLLGRGATINTVVRRHGNSNTAFRLACYDNQPECAEALVRAGCDVGIKDSNGQTGREVAEAWGSKEAARRLRALARQPFVGVLVELAGLVGAAEHNGKRATVMSARPSRGHHTSVFLARARASCLHSAQSSKSAMRGSRMAVELTSPLPLPPAVPGAALLAGEAALHA